MQYMRQLVPNSDLTSLMYFEQRGNPTVVENHNRWYGVEASLSLVCWFNYQKVDPDMYSPEYVVSQIVNAIPFSLGNFSCLTAVTCSYAGQEPNDGSVFDKYTYNEPESQFFKYPYEHVVLNFDVSYRVVRGCQEEDINQLPVPPIVLYMKENDDKLVWVSGVSGKEYQVYALSIDNTTRLARSLQEFSGYEQSYIITPKVGKDLLFYIDYGREYLRQIRAKNQNVYRLLLPTKPSNPNACMRLDYIDLSDNVITSQAYLITLIDYLHFSEINDGRLYLDGGTNAAITDVGALAQIAELIARGWIITYNT